MAKQKLMGRKRGMTQRFDNEGNLVVCTVIEAAPNIVTQVKTAETDGYAAVQTSFDAVVSKDERRTLRLVGKPLAGHYKKANVAPSRFLIESRCDGAPEMSVGDEVTVALFEEGQFVDVTGTSKGKGFAGLMKKNNFSGGPAAHGSGFHRRAGSTGMRSTPGRCLPGGPRPSQMGNEKSTVQNLRVLAVDTERNLLLVRGAVPGAKGSVVVIGSAVKNPSSGFSPSEVQRKFASDTANSEESRSRRATGDEEDVGDEVKDAEIQGINPDFGVKKTT